MANAGDFFSGFFGNLADQGRQELARRQRLEDESREEQKLRTREAEQLRRIRAEKRQALANDLALKNASMPVRRSLQEQPVVTPFSNTAIGKQRNVVSTQDQFEVDEEGNISRQTRQVGVEPYREQRVLLDVKPVGIGGQVLETYETTSNLGEKRRETAKGFIPGLFQERPRGSGSKTNANEVKAQAMADFLDRLGSRDPEALNKAKQIEGMSAKERLNAGISDAMAGKIKRAAEFDLGIPNVIGPEDPEYEIRKKMIGSLMSAATAFKPPEGTDPESFKAFLEALNEKVSNERTDVLNSLVSREEMAQGGEVEGAIAALWKKWSGRGQ